MRASPPGHPGLPWIVLCCATLVAAEVLPYFVSSAPGGRDAWALVVAAAAALAAFCGMGFLLKGGWRGFPSSPGVAVAWAIPMAGAASFADAVSSYVPQDQRAALTQRQDPPLHQATLLLPGPDGLGSPTTRTPQVASATWLPLRVAPADPVITVFEDGPLRIQAERESGSEADARLHVFIQREGAGNVTLLRGTHLASLRVARKADRIFLAWWERTPAATWKLMHGTFDLGRAFPRNTRIQGAAGRTGKGEEPVFRVGAVDAGERGNLVPLAIAGRDLLLVGERPLPEGWSLLAELFTGRMSAGDALDSLETKLGARVAPPGEKAQGGAAKAWKLATSRTQGIALAGVPFPVDVPKDLSGGCDAIDLLQGTSRVCPMGLLSPSGTRVANVERGKLVVRGDWGRTSREFSLPARVGEGGHPVGFPAEGKILVGRPVQTGDGRGPGGTMLVREGGALTKGLRGYLGRYFERP